MRGSILAKTENDMSEIEKEAQYSPFDQLGAYTLGWYMEHRKVSFEELAEAFQVELEFIEKALDVLEPELAKEYPFELTPGQYRNRYRLQVDRNDRSKNRYMQGMTVTTHRRLAYQRLLVNLKTLGFNQEHMGFVLNQSQTHINNMYQEAKRKTPPVDTGSIFVAPDPYAFLGNFDLPPAADFPPAPSATTTRPATTPSPSPVGETSPRNGVKEDSELKRAYAEIARLKEELIEAKRKLKTLKDALIVLLPRE